MKRDFNLIRKLVLAVEDGPTGNVTEDIKIDGYTPEQIGYHSYLIVNSGFAEGIDMGAMGDTSPNWQIINLTSAGHDFADTARSDSTWNTATDIIKEKAGGVTLDILKQVLIGVMKSGLGL